MAKAPNDLPELAAELNFVYAHVGALDRVLEYPERVAKINNMGSGFAMIWDPLYAPVRKTQRFKSYSLVGLMDYWRARGWPISAAPSAQTISSAIVAHRPAWPQRRECALLPTFADRLGDAAERLANLSWLTLVLPIEIAACREQLCFQSALFPRAPAPQPTRESLW